MTSNRKHQNRLWKRTNNIVYMLSHTQFLCSFRHLILIRSLWCSCCVIFRLLSFRLSLFETYQITQFFLLLLLLCDIFLIEFDSKRHAFAIVTRLFDLVAFFAAAGVIVVRCFCCRRPLSFCVADFQYSRLFENLLHLF